MKKIVSLMLMMAIVLGMLTVPVSAHQNLYFATDFEDYNGTWNYGTTGNYPPISGGTLDTYAYYAFSENYGITSATAKDAKYGTSLKVYQAYVEGSGVYCGAKFAPNVKPENSVYIGLSANVESTANNTYITRSLRVQGDTYGIILPFHFDQNYMYLFGTAVTNADGNYRYLKDKWYDFKIWLNMNTGNYTVEVWLDGVKLDSKTGNDTALKSFTYINRLEFFHNVPCNHNDIKTDAQVTYFDNFEMKTIYNFEIDETTSASHAVMDFEGYTNTDTLGVYPSGAGKGSWWAGYQGAGYHGLFAAESSRGTSARIDVPAITKNADGTYTIDGYSGTLDRLKAVYTAARYDLHPSYYIKDAIYFKTSVLFEDTNFNNFTIQFNNHGHSPFMVTPGGIVRTFNDTDTGLTFAEDVWYDIECTLDVDTRYYTVRITDGTNTYEGAGFSTNTVDGPISRINYLFYNNDTTMANRSSMLLDDVQIGSVAKLKAPVSGNFDFEDDIVPVSFTTTGGTAAITDGAYVISGAESADTVSSMSLPFRNTTFAYSADIDLDDLSANRTFKATTATASYDILTLGADGSLKIGNETVEDVTVKEGTYSVDIVFNQALYTADVTVSDADGIVATDSVTMGTAAVCITNVSWNISAAKTVTSLDNVSYNTIFSFEINKDLSVTGEDAIVEALDDVIVSFTNPVDRNTFTNDTVTVNSGNVFVEDIQFIDNFTAKIVFAKDQGTHYYVRFTGVADLYGNTLTDYVEFDTIRQDLVMSAVGFTRGSESLSLSSPGEVVASFNAKANNGTSFDMLYSLAMYEGGRLVNEVHDVFTVGETMEPHTLNITIPNDNKYYVLKAFVLDANTLEAYVEPAILKPTSDLPVVILKFDDLNLSTASVDKFVEVEEWATENNIKMGFGVMGYSVPGATDKVKQSVQHMNENPLIELWNHGYAWQTIFATATYEEAMADFESADAAAEALGIRYTAFNPPSNAFSENLRLTLNDNPQYSTVMLMYDKNYLTSQGFIADDNNFNVLCNRLQAEIVIHDENGNSHSVINRLDNLKQDWQTAKDNGYEYVVIQSHPGVAWGVAEGRAAYAHNNQPNPNAPLLTYGGAGNTMYDFILWLKSQGAVFMTPSEYTAYSSAL